MTEESADELQRCTLSSGDARERMSEVVDTDVLDVRKRANAQHFMRSANIKPGESILINGAGGSIGAHAVQIAKAMGAVVTAVDHAGKQDMLQRLGADHVVDYNRDDFRRAGRHYDVIFDMVPSGAYSSCIELLNPGGRYLSGNPRFFVMIRCFLTNRFTNKSASFSFAGETKDELGDLRNIIEAGIIRRIVDRVLPMDKAADAHRLVESEIPVSATRRSIPVAWKPCR